MGAQNTISLADDPRTYQKPPSSIERLGPQITRRKDKPMTGKIEKKGRGGGPRTQAGKAASSKNSTKHGLLSPSPVVATERREEFDDFARGIVDSLDPVGTLELELAAQAASLLWRRRRITRYEAEMISLSIEEVDGKLNRVVEADYFRDKLRFIERLPTLDDEEPVGSDDACSILSRISEHAGTNLEEIDLPGIPAGTAYDHAEWNGAKLKGAISAVANAAGMEEEYLILAAKAEVRKEAEEAAKRVAVLAYERFSEKLLLDRIYRERVLPDEKTLEKITRYEAHMTRQLNQTLHELEALQVRRRGGNPPLARLDVQG
jgi:hypothetical protein